MEINKTITDDDLITFLLNQHKQTGNVDFMSAANAIRLYRRDVEFLKFQLDQKNKWISVDDELPKKDGRYLVAIKHGDNYHISTRKFKRASPPVWWKGTTYGVWARYTGGVRFWAELPTPPTKEG